MPVQQLIGVEFRVPSHCCYCMQPFDQGHIVSSHTVTANGEAANCIFIIHYHAICQLKDSVDAALNAKGTLPMEAQVELLQLAMRLVNGLTDSDGRTM